MSNNDSKYTRPLKRVKIEGKEFFEMYGEQREDGIQVEANPNNGIKEGFFVTNEFLEAFTDKWIYVALKDNRTDETPDGISDEGGFEIVHFYKKKGGMSSIPFFFVADVDYR